MNSTESSTKSGRETNPERSGLRMSKIIVEDLQKEWRLDEWGSGGDKEAFSEGQSRAILSTATTDNQYFENH